MMGTSTDDRRPPLHALESIESWPWCRSTGDHTVVERLSRPITSRVEASNTSDRRRRWLIRRRIGPGHHPILEVAGHSIPIARRQLLLPGGDNYFCRRRGSKGASPTTGPRSVVVVGRSVAVKRSAGAPTGAEAPAERPGIQACDIHNRFEGVRFMMSGLPPGETWPCRGVSRARCESWRHRTPAARSDARADRSPRPSPSGRGRSDPSARRSNCS